MSAADIIAQYPAFAEIMQVPEIADLLNQPGITANNFIAQLLGTTWWKTTSKTERDWLGLQWGDPAEATRQSNNAALTILEQASQMGINMSLAQAHDLAVQSISQGWDNNILSYHIAQIATMGGTHPGTLEATQSTLRGIAASQGVNISDQTAFDWSKNIAAGTATQQGFEDYAKNQAIMSHPYWEKQLNEGVTVRQLADPYVQRAAQTLEISPDSVDLSDPKWDFTQRDAKGQQTLMSQSAWQTKIMTDPAYQWQQTDNAKQAGYNIVDQLTKTFGNRV